MKTIKKRSVPITVLSLLAQLIFINSASAHDKVGVIDAKGKFIIPANYERIDYLGAGIYKCYPVCGDHWARTEHPENGPAGDEFWRADEKLQESRAELRDKYNRPFPRTLSHKSNCVTVKLSESECLPFNDPALGRKLPAHSKVLRVTKESLIYQVGTGDVGSDVMKGDKLVFADRRGNVQRTIRCIGLRSWPVNEHLAVIMQNAHRQNAVMRINFNDGIIDEHGNWVIQPTFCALKLAESDRFIETKYKEHFDSAECKAERYSLNEHLPLLLQDYKLVGMSRSQIRELIGAPDKQKGILQEVDVYMLTGFGNCCGNAYAYLEISYGLLGQATGWRRTNWNGEDSPRWLVTNRKISS